MVEIDKIKPIAILINMNINHSHLLSEPEVRTTFMFYMTFFLCSIACKVFHHLLKQMEQPAIQGKECESNHWLNIFLYFSHTHTHTQNAYMQ